MLYDGYILIYLAENRSRTAVQTPIARGSVYPLYCWRARTQVFIPFWVVIYPLAPPVMVFLVRRLLSSRFFRCCLRFAICTVSEVMIFYLVG